MNETRYPWYEIAGGAELSQGDILTSCPVVAFAPGLESGDETAVLSYRFVRAVVLTQSCDLVTRDGKARVRDVILCPVFTRDEVRDDPQFGREEAWEDARKGRHASMHVLNRCLLTGLELDYALVDLGRGFSIPLDLAMKAAERGGSRIRLNPPYREHLSQAFARFFMRVGLPVDIPPFKKLRSQPRAAAEA